MKYHFRGYTLIALLMVASGCTANKRDEIASMPSVAKMKAEQAEAETMLAQIFAMQQGYFATNREYASSLDEIGVVIPSSARYHYALTANGSSWTCEATANLDQDATTDRWQTNQDGALVCVSNDATS